MKKINKTIAMLCLLVLLTGLVACTETPDTPPPQDDVFLTVSPPDRIQLSFSLWGDPAEQEATQAALNVYNNLQDLVWVNALQIPNEEYADVLKKMANAGNMPDCGMVNEATVLGWARDGLLMPIDIFAGLQHRPLEYLAFKDGSETVTYSSANEVLALWFNREMFDNAGIEYPPTTLGVAWTWDEFIETAKQLTFDANGNTPNDADFDKNNIRQYGAYVNQWTWQLEVWALSNGGKWFSEDGSRVIFDDAAIEAMQKVVDLHLVHNVAPFIPATSDTGFAQSMAAGNVAMTTEGQWAVGFYPDLDINYGVAVLPYMQHKANIATGGPVAVFAGTGHPDEVADFVRWYTDEENNFALIEAGWWMPSKLNWYSEPLLTKWIDNVALRARLPAEAYRTAIADVAMDFNVTQPASWYYTPYTYEIINTILNPAMVEAIRGNKTVAQVIDEVRPRMEAALQG